MAGTIDVGDLPVNTKGWSDFATHDDIQDSDLIMGRRGSTTEALTGSGLKEEIKNISASHGQCILIKDGTNLLLKPYNGNKLIINNKVETIPDSGITVSPSGLLADTTYYIYAYMNSATMTLVCSTTNHSTQASTAVEVKSDDVTRTLVGIARTNASINWEDTIQKRFVRSWFNRTPVSLKAELNATVATASIGWIELNSNERIEFVSFADETIQASSSGRMVNSLTGGGLVAINIGLNGVTPIGEGSAGQYGGGPISVPASSSGSTSLTEGYNYITLLGSAVASGTAIFHADGTNLGDATGLTGVLM